MTTAPIVRTYLHGSGVPLDPGTRLRPADDEFIYATTDPDVADAFAFRNAVYEWQKNLAVSGRARFGRLLPPRPTVTGWVLTVTATQPALVDPDFSTHPGQFMRFPGHSKVVVTDCRPGAITSWRE